MHKRTDAHTHDGHNAMTIAHWPLASGAKNDKNLSHENKKHSLLFPEYFQKSFLQSHYFKYEIGIFEMLKVLHCCTEIPSYLFINARVVLFFFCFNIT